MVPVELGDDRGVSDLLHVVDGKSLAPDEVQLTRFSSRLPPPVSVDLMAVAEVGKQGDEVVDHVAIRRGKALLGHAVGVRSVRAADQARLKLVFLEVDQIHPDPAGEVE